MAMSDVLRRYLAEDLVEVNANLEDHELHGSQTSTVNLCAGSHQYRLWDDDDVIGVSVITPVIVSNAYGVDETGVMTIIHNDSYTTYVVSSNLDGFTDSSVGVFHGS
jgi:hypothetical protein